MLPGCFTQKSAVLRVTMVTARNRSVTAMTVGMAPSVINSSVTIDVTVYEASVIMARVNVVKVGMENIVVSVRLSFYDSCFSLCQFLICLVVFTLRTHHISFF